MKHLIVAAIASIFVFGSHTVYAAETKKACVDQKQKDGKVKQVCKDIKVHKKLEGTPVPGQKK